MPGPKSILNSVRHMVERAGAAETIDDALRWILDILDDVVPGDVKAFLLLQEDGATLRVKTGIGLEPEFIGRFEKPVEGGIVADVIWGGHVRGVREADPSSDEYKELRLDRTYGSGLAAPVGAGARRFGYLWVQSEKDFAYALKHMNLVSLAGSLAGEVVSHISARAECAKLVPIELETGLLRHIEFMRRLSLEIDRAKRNDNVVSVILLHVEGLVRVRARGGRPRVDEVVREVARVARAALRGVDFLGHQGGGRIEICVPETPTGDALIAARRLREDIMQLGRETWPGSPVGASLGIAEFPADAEDARGLVANASTAALAARQSEGEHVVRYAGDDDD
ncbi:MAG: sensor domain-containing diguanylate cyclase [Planctomycetota bacterium]